MVRGSNRDLSKEGPQSATPQKLGSKENNQNTFCWGSQRDRVLQNSRTYVITQRAEQDQLQLEREENKTLQEELERVRTLYETDSKSNEAGVQELVDKEIKPHRDLVSQNLPLVQNPTTERDDSRQKMPGDLQIEREEKTILQEELDRVRILSQEDRQKYEADMLTVTQWVDDLQKALDTEFKSRAERESQDKNLLQKLMAELQEERRNKQILQEEVDRVRASCQEDRQRCEADMLTVTQWVDDLQQGLDTEIKSCTNRESQYKIWLQMLGAELQEERKNQQIIQEELDSVRASCIEDRQRYDANIITVTECVYDLRQGIDTEIKSCAEKESQYKICLQKLRAELQDERKNKQILQEKLDSVRAQCIDDSQRYDTDILTVTPWVEDLQQALDMEIKSCIERDSQDKNLLQKLRAEQDDEHQEEMKNKQIVQEELDRVNVSCQEDRQVYEAEVLTLMQRADDLQQGLDFEIKSRTERESQHKNLLQKLRAEQGAEHHEEMKNKQILQEELDRVRASCQEDRQVYEAEVLTLMQRAEDLQQGLDFEIKSRANRESQYKICLQKLRAELQDDRKNQQILHEKLHSVRASRREDRQRYEDDILTVRQCVSDLQQALDTEIESRAEIESQEENLQKLRSEQDAELQEETKNKQILQEELDRVRASCQEDRQRCEADILTERQRADDLQDELDKLQIPTKQRASSWKRVRHLLGLRKRQRSRQRFNAMMSQPDSKGSIPCHQPSSM